MIAARMRGGLWPWLAGCAVWFALTARVHGDPPLTLSIDGRIRHFHGYCDLADKGSPQRMRTAIIERESRPVRAMTREERLEHIWSSTADDYRGYAGERWPEDDRGKRTVMFFARPGGTTLKVLEDLTDAEVEYVAPGSTCDCVPLAVTQSSAAAPPAE